MRAWSVFPPLPWALRSAATLFLLVTGLSLAAADSDEVVVQYYASRACIGPSTGAVYDAGTCVNFDDGHSEFWDCEDSSTQAATFELYPGPDCRDNVTRFDPANSGRCVNGRPFARVAFNSVSYYCRHQPESIIPIIGAVCGGVGFILLAGLAFLCVRRSRRPERDEPATASVVAFSPYAFAAAGQVNYTEGSVNGLNYPEGAVSGPGAPQQPIAYFVMSPPLRVPSGEPIMRQSVSGLEITPAQDRK